MAAEIVSPVSDVDVPYIPYLERIANIVYPTKTVIFVTAKNWGRIIREVQVKATIEDPLKVPDKTIQHRPMQIMSLLVVNAGTDNQEVVNKANEWAEQRAGFREKHDAFRVKPEEKVITDAFYDDPARFINDPKDAGQFDE